MILNIMSCIGRRLRLQWTMAIAVAAMVTLSSVTRAEPVKGEMLSRNPSNVALALMSDFEMGRTSREIYTEPHIVRHNYEDFDKYRKLDKPPRASGASSRWAEVKTESLRVIDGDGAVTVLLTNRIKSKDGREFLHQAASVYFLNDEGKIYRVEAYYDPYEQQRDSFLREHLDMYDGIVEK